MLAYTALVNIRTFFLFFVTFVVLFAPPVTYAANGDAAVLYRRLPVGV